MRYTVCSVYDEAAQCFGRPIFAPAIGAAVRSLADEVNRSSPDNQMFLHPADFKLFHLGLFDDSTGLFELNSRPEKIADGSSLKA